MKTKIKKTHKLIAAALAVGALSAAFVGCGDAKTNEKPKIEGANDFDCIINEPVDLLSRVGAFDKEDGDITPKMKISVSPEVQVTNGIAIFPEEAEYEVTYSVTDSDGNKATAKAYVTTYDRLVYEDFKLVDMNGFSIDVGGSATLDKQSVVGDGDQSRLLFKVTGAASDADVGLSRTYTLDKGHEYTFKYVIKSGVAGTAKVKIGDGEAADITVAEGDNELTFAYDTTEAEDDKVEINVQLLLGGLGDNIEIEFVKAETSYQGIRDSKVSLVSGKNVHDRFDGTSGVVQTSEDKSSATLKVTAASDADYKAGMFINTDYSLIAGVEYTVKFNVTAANASKYDVVIQNRQWDERKYETVTVEQEGLTEKEIKFTPTAEDVANKDELWLYVQSGKSVNEIIISDIEVTRGELQHDSYDIELVKTESHEDPSDENGGMAFESIEGRFDTADGRDSLEGTATLSDDKKSATVQITTPCDASWAGGMFIKTGATLEADVEYTLSFDVTTETANHFAVIVQNKQWGEDRYEFINFNLNADEQQILNKEHKVVKFTPTADNITKSDELWLYVEAGDQINNITISNFKVTTDEENDGMAFESIEGRFDKNDGRDSLEGTATLSDDKKSATVAITTPCDASWAGGMFIKTGATLEAGVEYTLSFDVTTETANHFAVIVQNKQWGEDRYDFINFNLNADEQQVLNKEHKVVKFTPTADNITKSDELWLYVEAGDQINNITISNFKVTTDETEGEPAVQAESAPDNVIARFDGTEGTVETSEDKKSATLKVTQASEDDWRAGMFINTGCTLASGVKYKVSFDVTAENASLYEVLVQNRQWDEIIYGTVSVEQAGLVHKEVIFTPTVGQIENKNELWLYVRSGKSVNEITLSNLKVEVLGEDEEYDSDTVTITETFTCHNLFKMFAYAGASNYAEWTNGKLVFTVAEFGTTDWHNKIEGPNFDMGMGEFGDYYVSFKAKATAPVKVVFVGPMSGPDKWDPNLVWADITLSETETLYTFKSNAMSIPATHHMEWQFGWTVNGQYEDVVIEISEIKICYKSFID